MPKGMAPASRGSPAIRLRQKLASSTWRPAPGTTVTPDGASTRLRRPGATTGGGGYARRRDTRRSSVRRCTTWAAGPLPSPHKSASVAEVTGAGKDHRDAVGVTNGDRLRIFLAAAGLNDRTDAGFREVGRTIRHREVCVARANRPPRTGTRHTDRQLAGLRAIHLAGP